MLKTQEKRYCFEQSITKKKAIKLRNKYRKQTHIQTS